MATTRRRTTRRSRTKPMAAKPTAATPTSAKPATAKAKAPKPATGKPTAPKPQKAEGAAATDPLLARIEGASHHRVGGASVDILKVGNGRIKRLVYPPGFRWSTHMQAVVGTDQCMHAHVGFLARGHIQGEYADGCAFEAVAPRALVVEPGHDAWVVGPEPAVLIQFDCEDDTARRFGLPEEHSHA